MGLDYMEAVGKAWILVAYQIQRLKPISLGQKITVGTTPTDFKGAFGERQFFIKDEEGRFLVKANSLWILMDMSDRKPIRITEEDMKMYSMEKAFDDIAVSRKMKLSTEREKQAEYKVLKTYIDSNGHMNNADYIRVATELLPEDFQWQEMHIIYQKEVLEGDTMIPYIHNEPEGIGISIENTDGEVITKIKFK